MLNMVSAKTFCGFAMIPFHLELAVAELCRCLYGRYQTNHIMHSTLEAKQHLNFTFHALQPMTSLKSGVCRMTRWLEK